MTAYAQAVLPVDPPAPVVPPSGVCELDPASLWLWVDAGSRRNGEPSIRHYPPWDFWSSHLHARWCAEHSGGYFNIVQIVDGWDYVVGTYRRCTLPTAEQRSAGRISVARPATGTRTFPRLATDPPPAEEDEAA